MGSCPACVSLLILALIFPPDLPNDSAAREWWQRGEQAIDANDPDRAIRCYRHSLSLDPGLTRNHLSLAAAHLEKGEDRQAADQLARYLEAWPDEVLVRGQFVALLADLGRVADAAVQQERVIADLQANEALAERHLVDAHTRLMEFARLLHDRYREHVHRGIALYHLGRQRAAAPDPGGELPAEGLFLKAAEELRQARRHREEARTCWYLSRVWAALGRQHPARTWLRAAWSEAPFGSLTPTERRDLHQAWQAYRDESGKK